MNSIYRTIGISKQAFHQWLDRSMIMLEEQESLLPIIRQIRRDHPMLSCRQIYQMVKPASLGRDRFEVFCHTNGFKVERKVKKYRTTDSRGFIYFPNLLLTMNELSYINQLWVSDITYYALREHVFYLTFITDIYNREIIGYSASTNLLTHNTTLPALNRAIAHRKLKKDSGLTFHSDGGGQYYCKAFVARTNAFGINNSMGKTAYENPHAERINGIIKNDYLIPYQPTNFFELKKMLAKAVGLYNQQRPHQALNGNSPENFKKLVDTGLLTKKWIINKKKKVSKKEKVNINIK